MVPPLLVFRFLPFPFSGATSLALAELGLATDPVLDAEAGSDTSTGSGGVQFLSFLFILVWRHCN